MGGGGRLDFDLDFLPTISAPDVAAVLEAVTGTKSKALGFFILTWIVASESHGDKEGAPKIPPAVNIPSKVASPTTATTTSSCPPGAPTGTDAVSIISMIVHVVVEKLIQISPLVQPMTVKDRTRSQTKAS